MNKNLPILMRDYVADARTAESLGTAMLQCHGMLVPAIAPELAMLIVNCPRPIVTNNEPADYNLAGGLQLHTAGAPKTRYDGSISLIETDFGQATAFAELLMSSGGSTDCIYYDGHPTTGYVHSHELKNATITFESPEYDAEGVSTIQRVSGQIKYNYFGVNASMGRVGSENKQTQGAIEATQVFYDRANKILNAVYAGNSLARILRDLF